MKIEREYPSFIITKKGSAWVNTGHPWIYAQEIISKSAEPENGALVDALSENGRYLGTGLYSRESKIGLRLISRNANDRFDAEFWKRRIRYAWDYRRTSARAHLRAKIAARRWQRRSCTITLQTAT